MIIVHSVVIIIGQVVGQPERIGLLSIGAGVEDEDFVGVGQTIRIWIPMYIHIIIISNTELEK